MSIWYTLAREYRLLILNLRARLILALTIYCSNDDLPTDKKQREAKLQTLLQAASDNITTLAGAAADIKTVELDCPQKFHKAVIGQGGSTLRALLGEDSMATVNLPRKDAKENLDIITIKGPSQEVDQLVTRVNAIIEEAKADVLLNGHVSHSALLASTNFC